VTNLAALRWMLSILLMLACVCGSHTVEAYSSDDRTNVL
jgi:hypothetical protein